MCITQEGREATECSLKKQHKRRILAAIQSTARLSDPPPSKTVRGVLPLLTSLLFASRDSYARRCVQGTPATATTRRSNAPLYLDYDRRGVAIHKSEGERRSLREPFTVEFINYYPLSHSVSLSPLPATASIVPPTPTTLPSFSSPTRGRFPLA